jgi:hypothetical protein
MLAAGLRSVRLLASHFDPGPARLRMRPKLLIRSQSLGTECQDINSSLYRNDRALYRPMFTARLSSFLTSRLRKRLVLVAFAAVLAEWLESYWITKTFVRWTSRLYSDWASYEGLAYYVCYTSMALMLLVDFGGLVFCGF